MGSSILKWLASLGTGLVATILLYLQNNAGDATTPIEGIDPIISGLLITLVTKGVTWLVAKFGPAPTTTRLP